MFSPAQFILSGLLLFELPGGFLVPVSEEGTSIDVLVGVDLRPLSCILCRLRSHEQESNLETLM